MRPWKMSQSCRPQGFTLVEILIVVVILGILAAIVVPQFSNAALTARQNALRDNLRQLRTQVLVYSSNHNNRAPGYPAGSNTATEQTFIDQMTGPTDGQGNTNDVNTSVFKYGPYLNQVPVNPVNNLRTVRIVGLGAFPTEAMNTHGWVYQPSTLTIASDAAGADESGVDYINY